MVYIGMQNLHRKQFKLGRFHFDLRAALLALTLLGMLLHQRS